MITSPTKSLSGILVATITPFTDDGSAIDEERYQAHIDRLFDAGCHGIVPGGSTGEFTSLTMEEREQVVEIFVKFARGRGPVVAGTGVLTTRDCLRLARHAATAGASALMVVPPFYDPVNLKQLRQLMLEIHDASKLPIEIAGLSDVGVKYLKDTSGKAPVFSELVFSLHDQITAFNGWDTLTFYSLAAGCQGAVWGASNIIPELSAELWTAMVIKHDLKAGRELWAKIYPLCAFLESHHYSCPVKTAMELLGHKTGGVRSPFQLLDEEPRLELAGILSNAGLKVVV